MSLKEKVDEKLSSSFSEMGTGMKTGATTVMGKGMKTGATVMGKGATVMGKGATVMGKGMKTSYQSMKDKILKKMNKNRLIFILQNLSEEELEELEEYIERNIENTITENDERGESDEHDGLGIRSNQRNLV
jgi:hypothetical protein